MIRIETASGVIMAEAVITGIPVDPIDPPSMMFIDPHRRWQVQAERIWMRQPWIATGPDGYAVYHLGPASYRPDLWGQFETLQQAADYITNPPPPTPVEPDDFDMDFRNPVRLSTAKRTPLFARPQAMQAQPKPHIIRPVSDFR